MNRLLAIRFLFLVPFLSSISCQSIHFCQALKDNNGIIDYSLNVPNGTFHRKFIIIKNHFWELEYNPTISRRKRELMDATESSFKPGPVFLKDLYSKQSEWLGGEYQLAFAIRFGSSDQEWTKTSLALVNTNDHKYDWSLCERNFGDLRDVLKKETTKLDLGDFKPQVAYNTFSRQDQNTVIFIEQKQIIGQKNRYVPTIQAYNVSDPSKGLSNETNDPWLRAASKRKIVPHAINATSSFYKIKGLFGTLIPDSQGNWINGTIILIEYCGAMLKMRSTDSSCQVPLTYNYCIAEESEENPLEMGAMACHPAKVDQQKLADCSNPDEWTAGPSLAPHLETSQFSAEISRDSTESNKELAVGQSELPSPNSTDPGKNGSLLWIIIVIVVIIIIIVILVIILGCCRSKSKGEAPTEGVSTAKPSSKMGSVRSGDVKSGADMSASSSRSKKLNKGLAKPSPANDSMSVPSVRSSIK